MTFAQLPEVRDPISFEKVGAAIRARVDAIVVLDDDPTGTQTVHDVPVLTRWEMDVLHKELSKGTFLFYILTNSRSLSARQAAEVMVQIGSNLRAVADKMDLKIWVISRSDSTLRGHFPLETDALVDSMRINDPVCFLVPAFFEGDRYTIGNVHYLQQESDLVPVNETAFARDKVFGFENANLKDWILEKSDAQISGDNIKSFSLKQIRGNSCTELSGDLTGLQPGDHCVVNAASYEDLTKFCLAIIQADINPIFRTAASFVAALVGQSKRPLLQREELSVETENGALMVVGSYVPLTTQQLAFLHEHCDNILSIEVEVQRLLTDESQKYVQSLQQKIERGIEEGQDVMIYTSRELVSVVDKNQNLAIGRTVSQCLIDLVTRLHARPRYVLAKGGITSSDIATEALGVDRAMVLGQIIPGVPVWRLEEESKYPGLTYIVFPGNVGGERGLYQVIRALE